MTGFQQSHPVKATIKKKVLLSKKGAERKTYHLVLDLQGHSLPFKEGDSAAVFPANDPEVVQKTLKALKKTGNEVFIDEKYGEISLADFLTYKVSITKFPVKLAKKIIEKNPGNKESLLENDKRSELDEYIASYELWDFLSNKHPCDLSIDELRENLLPQQPRYYSIASAYSPNRGEMDLLVILVTYETSDILRKGVATNFLIHLAKEKETPIPLFVHPARQFTLPEDSNKDIIMIGAGTGLAPYRAFLQKREMQGAKGRNWLIFGERKRDEDFYYSDELLNWEKEKFLKLDLAFSRDQKEKIYVQHKLLENGKEIYEWLEKGACFYICGKGKSMAKDVHDALLSIIQTHGNNTQEETIEYLSQMRKDARYMRDVY